MSAHLASYVVTASDAVGGQAITQGTVIVRDTFGNVALTTGLGSSFWYAFAPRQVIEIVNHHRIVELVYPTVTASLNAPYSDVDVDLGVP